MFNRFIFWMSLVVSAPPTQSLVSDLGPRVLWIPLKGTVELGLSPYISRGLEYAESQKFDWVIIEVDTFGGRVDAAVNIRDALLQSKVKTVAWVHNRAISAGALISIACQKIYFSPGSTMGAATPIQIGNEGAQDAGKKFVSYFRGEMGATAENRKRDRKIAEAMVMATDEIPGLVKKDDVLTLTEKTALEFKFSDGTADSRESLFSQLGITQPQVEEFGINWAERIVRMLTEPEVSGLLMSAGILGIIFELKSPGFGLPGVIGISCLGLYFFSKYLVHLAGLEEILLFILGIILIGLELFVFPGTVVIAIIGLGFMIAALFLAGVSPKVPLNFELPEIQSHLNSITIAFTLAVLGIIALFIMIARNPNRLPLILRGQIKGDGHSAAETQRTNQLLRARGTLVSDLRPSGKAAILDQVIAVESSGEYLERGTEIEVISIEGPRILVRAVGRT